MSKYETVWKTQIDLDRLDTRDRVKILLPAGAKIVHVAPVENAHLIEFWMRVDPEAPMESREFRVAGTGHPLVVNEHYLGTSHAGPLVWHLFEVLPSEEAS